MAAKKLEIDSKYAHLDIDGDGIVSDEEMMREERMIELADKRSDMENEDKKQDCLLYTSPSPRDLSTSRMPSSA